MFEMKRAESIVLSILLKLDSHSHVVILFHDVFI